MSTRKTSKIKDTRLQCPTCKTKTWDRDYAYFMRDHDTMHGKVCKNYYRLQYVAATPELDIHRKYR